MTVYWLALIPFLAFIGFLSFVILTDPGAPE